MAELPTPDLLRDAAARLRQDPQYGACFGPEDRGKHVSFVELLEERAVGLEVIADSDNLALGPGPEAFDLVSMAAATCPVKGEPHLPTFIDAKRVCYWCREPLE